MVKFSVHTITEAKQSNRQGGARAVPGRWIIIIIIINVKINVALSENASRTRYTIKIKLKLSWIFQPSLLTWRALV